MAADVYSEIRAVLEAAGDDADRDRLRREALSRCAGLDRVDWRPGDPAPDDSLDARWRRALAAAPDTLLGLLQRQRPPASARVFGNAHEFELVLPDGAGRLIVKFVPGHA